MPHWPWLAAPQNLSNPVPMEEVISIPVITTLFFIHSPFY
ncbi:hypothetical protein LDG_6083 [Legionella drancourtii LLAP12]|uniref:Uncharacterized protein n=1 Tax=Legionella drancourtii LLAP12 TaxID=658187 RepID=G9ELT2_9GAMM|nr:hypothetical protein LDG_6083 [Legionella drancourtii LLAP12]